MKHIPPPDQQRVHLVQQRIDHAQLVGHFRSTEHRDEGPFRFLKQAVEDLDLPRQDTAGGGGQEGGWTDDGGVRPVGGAKRVVYVEVLVFYQRRRRRRGRWPLRPG